MLLSQKDSLMEISFRIPNSNTQFVDDENRPPAYVGFFLLSGKIVYLHIVFFTDVFSINCFRFSVTKLCQWQMLVLEAKKLLLPLRVLLSSSQGRCCGCWELYMFPSCMANINFYFLQGAIQCWTSSLILTAPRTS